MPFPEPSTCDPLLVPEELSQTGSGSDGTGDIAELDNEPEILGPRGADSEEDDMDESMEASGAKPKAKEAIRDWHELQE
jgi:hypothetical protein